LSASGASIERRYLSRYAAARGQMTTFSVSTTAAAAAAVAAAAASQDGAQVLQQQQQQQPGSQHAGRQYKMVRAASSSIYGICFLSVTRCTMDQS
jgi:hypothetical protein